VSGDGVGEPASNEAHPGPASHPQRPEEWWSDGGITVERLRMFTDAVFAIAITLLAFNIKLPDLPDAEIEANLPRLLLGLWPQFLSYAITFSVLGIYWRAYHRVFQHIRRYDGRLFWLNLLYLFWIAFLPFPTSIVGQYGERASAAIFYAVSMAIASLILYGLWLYASRGGRLIEADLDPRLSDALAHRGLVFPAVFLGSTLVALVNPYLAELCWLLIIPGQMLVRRRARRSMGETRARE
jgi:uncharacterized membrane protein